MLLFLLNRRVINGNLSHNIIVQGVVERFVWVNRAQGHRNDALHDPRVKAALIIILYPVTNKSVPSCTYVRADPGWISLMSMAGSKFHKIDVEMRRAGRFKNLFNAEPNLNSSHRPCFLCLMSSHLMTVGTAPCSHH